jgi:tight adherence protein C
VTALLAATAALLATYGCADLFALRAARRSARAVGGSAPEAGAHGRGPAAGAYGSAPAGGAHGRAPVEDGYGRGPGEGVNGRAPVEGAHGSSRVVAVLARIGRGAGVRPPRSLTARIAAAGLDTPVADVMAVKSGAAVAGLAAGAVLAAHAPGRLGVALVVAVPATGFLVPDLWLRGRARARGAAIEAELADVLDLLRVAVAAGLAPRRALAEVGRRHPGLLAAELRRAAQRAALGVPAAAAIRELEARAPASGIAPLVAALQRAERHGVPLAPTLAAQAQEARARAAQRATEAAARAGPKIQLVVALLLVPAVMLLVAAALLRALAGG